MIRYNPDLGFQEVAPEYVQDLEAKAQELWHILDVRTTEEFAKAHIPGATNIPLHLIPLHIQDLTILSQEKPLLIYCEHGIRSRHAIEYLLSKNINSIINMRGGFCLWKNDDTVKSL